MGDEDYTEKLESLRRYIPFLKNMMTELKAKGNRQAQLIKIQSLHDMITDTRKKLKLDTLIKCEAVLTNIYVKVNPQIKSSKNAASGSTNDCVDIVNPPLGYDSSKFRDFPFIDSPASTPRSPSPMRNLVLNHPVTIPTEKVGSSTARPIQHISSKESRPKVDVYSNAVINKSSDDVHKVPDMSKPPISLDDLKTLEEDVHQKMSYATFANKTVFELQEYKKQLQLQLKVDEMNEAMGLDTCVGNDLINPTARNVHTPSSRLSYSEVKARRSNELSKAPQSSSNSTKELKSSVCDEKSSKGIRLENSSKGSSNSASLNNTVKEPDKFGNLLSSIDEKIIKEKKKSKKIERRSSVTRLKEDNGSSVTVPSGNSSVKNIEGKTKLEPKDMRDIKMRDDNKTIKMETSGSIIEKDVSKDLSKVVTNVNDKASSLSEIEIKCEIREKKKSEKNEVLKASIVRGNTIFGKEKVVCKRDSEYRPNLVTVSVKDNLFENKELEKVTKPTFKRLADKYNPKPKPKPAQAEILDIDKVVSDDIEKSMKSSSIKPLMPAFEPLRPVAAEKSTILCDTSSGVSSSCPDINDRNNSVQLPSILQNFFKPLFKDTSPKMIQPPAEPAPCASIYQNINSATAKQNILLSPQQAQSILSPHRPLLFEPPSPDHHLGQIGIMSPPNMLEPISTQMITRPSELSYSNCGSSVLGTPGVGLLPQPSFPSKTLRGGFVEPVITMSFNPPRSDFESPSTPRTNFESHHSEASYLNPDQYSMDQRFDSSHLDSSTYPNMDQYGLNQRFESPHLEPYANTNHYSLNQRFLPLVTDHNMQGFEARNSNFVGQNSFNNQGGFYGQSQTTTGTFEPASYASKQNYQQGRYNWFRNKGANDPRSYREYKEMKERQEKEARAAEERQRDIQMQRQTTNRDPRLLTRGANGESSLRDKPEILIRDPRLSSAREKSMDRSLNTIDDGGETIDLPNIDDGKHDNSKPKKYEDNVKNRDSLLKIDSCSKTQNNKLKSNKFDEMYSKTNTSESGLRSSNRGSFNEAESFPSSLASLYHGGENRNTSETFQKFRIPKKSRRELALEGKKRIPKKSRRELALEGKKRPRKTSPRKKARRSRCRPRRSQLSESDESYGIAGNDDESIQNKSDEELCNEDTVSKITAQIKDELTSIEKEVISNEKKIDTARIKVVLKPSKISLDDCWQSQSTAVGASEDIDDFVSEYDKEYTNSLLEHNTNNSRSEISECTPSEVPFEEDICGITKITQPSSAEVYGKGVEAANLHNEKKSNLIVSDSSKTCAGHAEVGSVRKPDGAEASQSTANKSDLPSEQNILAHFFENLLKSQNKKDKKTALFSLIETFSDSFEDREIQKIRKIIKADDEEREGEKEEDNIVKSQNEQPVVGSSTDGDIDLRENAKSEESIVTESRANEVTNSGSELSLEHQEEERTSDQATELHLNADFLEPIQMSVGERIKSRKRVVTKPRKKFKSELDFLHEDIQDMFIRDGVLTATGKRMCRMLKDDPNVLDTTKSKKSPEVEPLSKLRRKPMPKSKLRDSDFVDKSMRDMRVIINKIPDDILSSNRSSSRQLRRNTRRYVESDDEQSDHNSESNHDSASFVESVDAGSEKSDLDEESGNDVEDDKTYPSTGSSQKPRAKRRKGAKWAAGVIYKNKKKKTFQKICKEVSPDRAQSPISSVVSDMTSVDDLDDEKVVSEHDKNYFCDFKSKQKVNCKLCNYSGLNMTTHYLKEHPESEILTSRFPPDVAAQAIQDFAENRKILENIANSKMSTKYEYLCRLCGYESFINPITFYEHVTTHTGEYRHQCVTCKYITASSRSINQHFVGNHIGEEKKATKTSYSLATIFAYMCGECNYFQLDEKRLQNHINKFHTANKPPIYKVNMSTVTDKRLLQSDVEMNSTNEPRSDSSVAELHFAEPKPHDPIKTRSIVEPPKYRKPGPKPKKRPGPKSKTMGYFEEELNVPSDNENTPLARLCTSPTPTFKSKLIGKSAGVKERVQKNQADAVTATSTQRTGEMLHEDSSPKTSSRKRKRSLEKLIPEDSGDDLDTIITLSSRSCRAAKQKATAKLKSLMESSDGSPPKSRREAESPIKDESVTAERSSGEIHSEDFAFEKLDDQDTKRDSQSLPQVQTRLNSDNIAQSNEQDLNVFTCRADILQEDAKKIEEDRLRKMDELNKSIGSRPLKLEFVNKLSEMLSNEQFESERVSSVNVKVEPKDIYDTTDSQTSDGLENFPLVQQPEVFRSAQTHVATKKPVFEEQPAVQQSDIKFNQSKPNSLFSNMIEKLQGKVNEAAEQQVDVLSYVGTSAEKTVPVNNPASPASVAVLTIGALIMVTKRDNDITYSCIANNCYVSTKDKMVFQLHCKFGHKDLNLTSSLCDKCGIVIEQTLDTTLLENVYDHVVFAHSDFLCSNPVNIRMRRLSGDKLSIKEEGKPVSVGNDEKDTEPVMDYVAQNASSNNSVGSDGSFPIDDTLEKADDNPFSFKIASVMSLADSNDQPSDANTSSGELVSKLVPINNVPALSLIGSTTKQNKTTTSMLVKEAKMSASELSKPKKTPKAMKKFIGTPFDLYKCPHFYCTFSTNIRLLLIRHLKVHMSLNVIAMVPCVYCDIKTPWEHVPMHIDIRHANSRFSCNLCLYRAIIKEYVEIHQQVVHPDLFCRVISIPSSKSARKYSAVVPKSNLKSLCEPFRCTCKEGDREAHEFLFERDFVTHLHKAHSGAFLDCSFNNCGQKVHSSTMLNHWSLCHGVQSFQCSFCRTGDKDLLKVYCHFSQVHPSLAPDILDRRANLLSKEDLRYSDEAFKQISHIRTILPSSMPLHRNQLLPQMKLFQPNSPTGSKEPDLECSASKEKPSPDIPGSSLLVHSIQSLQDVAPTSSQSSQILVPGSNLQLIVSKDGNKDQLYLVPASVVSAKAVESVSCTASIGSFPVKTSTVSTMKRNDQPKEPVRIGNITIYPDEPAMCNPSIKNSEHQSIVTTTSSSTLVAIPKVLKDVALLTQSTNSSRVEKSASASDRTREVHIKTFDGETVSEKDWNSEDDLLQSAIQSILDQEDELSESGLTGKHKKCAVTNNSIATSAQSSVSNIAVDRPPLLIIANSPSNKNLSMQSQLSASEEIAPINKASDLQILDTVAPVEHIEIAENSDISEDSESSNKRTTCDVPVASTDSLGPLSADPLNGMHAFNIEFSLAAKDPLHVAISKDNKTPQVGDTAGPLKISDMQRSISMVSNSDDESDCNNAERKQRGLLGYQLFRCGSCNLSFSNVKSFKAHILSNLKCKQLLKCVHCEKHLKSIQRLADHILTHGVARFSCSLCDEKFTIASIARHHMKSRHSLNQTLLAALNSDQADPEVDCFVIKPSQSNPSAPKEKDVAHDSPKNTEDNLTYAPDQIDSIPIRQIFSTNLKCGVCNYQTKVRVNIIRHLQMHLEEKAVSDSAPVNPVPCLEKNEKMFDKMINFAASSITTGRMGGPAKDKKDEEKEELFPDYVPTHRRYVCGAEGCAYLCPEESNLKHHLMALHSDDNNLICAHCKIKIEPNDIENVMKHFKLHGLHLYKCHHCRFVHHLKHKIEKHSQDGHPDVIVKVDTIRYMESEPQEFSYQDEVVTQQFSPTKFKPWCCCMCKSKYNTREDVQAHIVRKHNVDTQYKCTLCAFKSDDNISCQDHFKVKHPTQAFDIVLMYQKVEEEVNEEQTRTPFDTTPLWQRDKQRVRHIRGILFDDSTPQPTKSAKKMKVSVKTAGITTPKAVSGSPLKDLPNSGGTTLKSSSSGSPIKNISNTSTTSSSSSNNRNMWDCIDAVARGTQDMLLDNQPGTSGLSLAKITESTLQQSDLLMSDKESKNNFQKLEQSDKCEERDNIDDSDDVIDVTQSPKIIVIDSEESDNENESNAQSDSLNFDDILNTKTKDSRTSPVSTNRGMKRSGSDLLQEALKMAKIDEPDDSDYALATSCSKDNLISMFGDLGEPHNKQWMCPKCRKFKSKRVGDFLFHIYKDFNLYRYRCKSCKDISITYKYMQDHLKVHPGCKEDIIEPLAVNIKLNTWIQMVLQKQSSVILENAPLFKKRGLTGQRDIRCYFCPKKFMSMPECCEHMLYHWVMMPYQCQHCPNEFYTVYDLKHHHQVEHPDAKIYLDPKGATLDKALQCIEKMKQNSKITSGTVINSPKKVKTVNILPKPDGTASGHSVISLEDEGDDLRPASKVNFDLAADFVYACDTCAYFADSQPEVSAHLFSAHGISGQKCHTLSKSKSNTDVVPKMACNICDEVFSELNLRRHFLKVHANLQALYSPYRFKCSLCSTKFYTKVKIKTHVSTVHGISQASFQSVTNQKPTGCRKSKYKEFSCTKCNFVVCSATTVPIRIHLKGHLKPIVCNHCSMRFQKQSDIALHSKLCHESIDQSFLVLDEVIDELTKEMQCIIKNATPILQDESAQKNGKRHFARKSTSAPLRRSSDEERSDGNLDLSTISTTFHLNDLEYTTTAQEMMKMINMEPYVDLSDCQVEVVKIDQSVRDDWMSLLVG